MKKPAIENARRDIWKDNCKDRQDGIYYPPTLGSQTGSKYGPTISYWT